MLGLLQSNEIKFSTKWKNGICISPRSMLRIVPDARFRSMHTCFHLRWTNSLNEIADSRSLIFMSPAKWTKQILASIRSRDGSSRQLQPAIWPPLTLAHPATCYQDAMLYDSRANWNSFSPNFWYKKKRKMWRGSLQHWPGQLSTGVPVTNKRRTV